MRKNQRKQATSLDEAIQMCADYAQIKHRRPAKVISDLMGVELKTYYRWMADSAMPINRIRQFESFCGCNYVSEYLCIAAGKVVIDIPTGNKTPVAQLGEMQANAGNAIVLLSRFYEGKSSLEETLDALNHTLTDMAYHRQNIIKHSAPELGLFGDGDA